MKEADLGKLTNDVSDDIISATAMTESKRCDHAKMEYPNTQQPLVFACLLHAFYLTPIIASLIIASLTIENMLFYIYRYSVSFYDFCSNTDWLCNLAN